MTLCRFFQLSAILLLSFALLATSAVGQEIAAPEKTLRDGDRVTLLGGTSIERMQQFGYFETLVASSFPKMDLKFRNLGWSGDDVSGIARAVFGKPADGFERLRSDLKLSNPTVVIICYGANESFGGRQQLPQFLSGLQQVVKVVQEIGARPILMSPHRIEGVEGILPDPSVQNQNLKLYSEAMSDLAKSQQVPFVDFHQPLGKQPETRNTLLPVIRDRLTDNGRTFNEYGHWRTAMTLAGKLGVDRESVLIRIDANARNYSATGTLLTAIGFGDAVEFSAIDDRIAYCRPPETAPRGGDLMVPHDRLQVVGLTPGNWGLQIDGKPAVMATAEEWAAGVFVNRGLYTDDADNLRRAILEKNELFFHRHRPQNETYLFLFRKHEQGNNAAEIPEFDRLVEEKEAEISELKKPQSHSYKLVRVEDR